MDALSAALMASTLGGAWSSWDRRHADRNRGAACCRPLRAPRGSPAVGTPLLGELTGPAPRAYTFGLQPTYEGLKRLTCGSTNTYLKRFAAYL